MKDSIVYVVQDPEGKELFPATQHGTLRVLLTGKEPCSLATAKIIRGLANIRPQDFLLPIGNLLNIGIATHVALTRLNGELKVLMWNRETYTYSVETIHVYDPASKPAHAAANQQ